MTCTSPNQNLEATGSDLDIDNSHIRNRVLGPDSRPTTPSNDGLGFMTSPMMITTTIVATETRTPPPFALTRELLLVGGGVLKVSSKIFIHH